MEIIVREIPEAGLELSLNSSQTEWFRHALVSSLGPLFKKGDQGFGELFLLRTDSNVDCSGTIGLDCHPACSRCSKEFRYHTEFPIHFTMAPLYESERQMKQEAAANVEVKWIGNSV